jgi:hypothetical protein
LSAFLPDLDTIRRAQAVIGAYTRTRLEIIAARPGNPLGAAFLEVGDAVALRAPGFPESPDFNCGYGFCDEQADELPTVLNWFAEAGVGGRFALAPGRETLKTMRLLTFAGYAQTGFHATTGGSPDHPSAETAGVEVRRVETEADLGVFGDVYHAGWDIKNFRVPMGPWLTAPGWRLYLALCDGAPAGCAILYVAGADAYLADSAVDPRFRRRSVHRALLDRRCADALEAGSDLIVSGADFLSASYRNQLRKGLGLLYTEAIWTKQL